MRFDRLTPNDRAVLVEIVTRIFSGGGAEAAENLLRKLSGGTLKLMRKLHAEEIVNQAVKLWIDAPASRSKRMSRAMLAGMFLPTYRKQAVKQVEDALAGAKRGKVVDVEYEVK